MQQLSAAEFHTEFQKTRPPGKNWFADKPDLLAVFEADFQRAIVRLDGFVRDNLSWLGTWDFDLGQVTARVRLVHGADDGMVPAKHGEWLHERLPNSQRHVVPGNHGYATFGGAVDTFATLTAPDRRSGRNRGPRWDQSRLGDGYLPAPTTRSPTSIHQSSHFGGPKLPLRRTESPTSASGGLAVAVVGGVDQAYADPAHALQIAGLGRGLAELPA
jgi:hypothetical protein